MPEKDDQLNQFLDIVKDAHSTTDILIAYAKMRLKNGKKLWKTNPILRSFTSKDIQIANLISKINNETPNVNPDIEKGDRIFAQTKKITDATVKPMLDTLAANYEKARQEAVMYMNERNEAKSKVKSLAKDLLDRVEKIFAELESENAPR